MIKTNFINLYEELSWLNESATRNATECKYTKAALEAFLADDKAKGVLIYTNIGNKIYNISQIYHDDYELSRLNYYIDQFIRGHGVVSAIHSKGQAEAMLDQCKDATIDDKVEYVDESEITDKELLHKTRLSGLKAGDTIEVLEDKYPAMYKSLMKHFNTNVFEIKDISLMPESEQEGDLVIISDKDVAISESKVKKVEKQATPPIKSETKDKPEENTEEEKPDIPAEQQTAQKAAQLSKKVIKAFKDAGLSTDELIVKNGVGKTKASAKLKKLKQSLFGESLEEDFDEELDIEE